MTACSPIRSVARFIKKILLLARGVFIFYRRHGLKRLAIRLFQSLPNGRSNPALRRALEAATYGNWIKKNEPTVKELGAQTEHHFKNEPLVSLVVPSYLTPSKFLDELLESVKKQTYRHWELIIVLAGQPLEGTAELINTAAKDSRIKFISLPTNQGIAANTNAGLNATSGEFIGFIDHDDTLAPFALFEVVQAINKTPEGEVLYSDEDKISTRGTQRFTPHFKPDWSPDLLRSYNYITHFLVVKKTLLDTIGLLNPQFDSCQDYDLVLRASEKAKTITHIPKILYHWREHEASTSFNPKAKPEVTELSATVVSEHLKRIGRVGKVVAGPFFGAVRIHYELVAEPLISIIIPNHEHAADLRTCISSIQEKSTYQYYEIIVMENNSHEPDILALYDRLRQSGVKVIKWESKFNYSQINNDGSKLARGDVILFLNNDVEIITPNWLEEMLMHLQFREVGAVGSKLYYPDDSIQHAGVILGVGGVAGHPHKGFSRDDNGYFGRLKVVQNFNAVTGACLMIKKQTFETVGGFDRELPIAFNDIDLCLKVRQQGLLIVWTPEAQLYHHESKTRGYENTIEKQKRFLGEIDYFKRKWSNTLNNGDSYYSPNLSLVGEDFSINA